MPRRAGSLRGRGRLVPAALVAVLAVLSSGLLLGAPATAQVLSDPGSATPTVTTSLDSPVVGLTVTAPRQLHWTWAQGSATATCTLVGPTPTDTLDLPCSGGALDLVVGTLPGDYALQVVLSDGVVTGSPGTSPSYTVHPVPGQPAVAVQPAPGAADDRDVQWSWTSPPGTTADCTLVAPDGVGASYAGCTSPLTTRLRNLPGPHRLDVVLTSNTGSSPAGSATQQLVVLPPAPAQIAGPTVGSSRAVSWTWPAAEDGGARCTLTGPVAPDAPSCSASGASVVLPEVNGDYVLTVVRTGPGGDSDPVSVTYRLTLPTPTGPVVSAPTVDAATRLATWTWSQAADESGTCTLTGPGGYTVTRDCRSTLTLPLPEANGDYSLAVVLSSVRGTSTPGYSPVYRLVLPVPARPTVTGPTGPASTRRVTWDWAVTGSERSTCTLVGPTSASRTDLPCSPPPLTTDLPAQSGTYRLEVVLDSPGGTSPVGTSPAYVLDLDPPAVPLITAGPPATGNAPTPSWTITVEAGSTGSCTVTRGEGTTASVVAGPVDCGDPAGSTYAPSLAQDGPHTLAVVARDVHGNTSTPATATYLLDTTAPAAPVLAGDRPAAGRVTAPSFSFTLPGDAVGAECRTTAPDGTVGAWAACTSPTALQLGLLPDGTYVLDVRSVDTAGNRTAVPATTPYLLDTTPPGLTVSGPQGTGNVSAPLWSWSATETPSSVACTLVRLGTAPDGTSTTTNVATADCADGSYRPTLPSDADYAVRVRVADRYGNARTATTAPYRFDATAPALPTVTGPTGRSTTRTVTWSWTGEGTPGCVLTRDGVEQAVGCTGRSLTTTLPGSGTYVLAVRMTDVAGNTGDAGSSAPYEVDVTAPDAPVVTVAALGRSRSPEFTLQAEAGAALRCRLVVPLGAGASVPCTSPYTADLSTAADGVYSLEVTATDALGNTSAIGSASYRLDTTAPAAPVVLGPVGTGNDAAPRYTWTGEAGTTATCRLVPRDAAVDCTAPFVPTLTADGSYAVQVALTDAAGNTGAAGTSGSYLYDGTAPAPAVITGPPGTGNTAAASWTFSGEGTARCRLVHDGAGGAWAPCAGGYAAVLDADGSWVLEVELTDAAGNRSTARSTAYLLDRQAPGAPGVAGPAGTAREATVSWSVAVESGTRVECRLTGADAGPFAACDPSVVRTLTNDGVHVLEARLVDLAGNTGPVGRSPQYLLDRVAPGAPSVGGPAGPSQVATPTWAFTADDGSTTECQVLRDGVPVSDWSGCGTPVTRDLSGQADGGYTLAVRATDAALNTGAPGSSPRYVLDRTAPAAPVVTGPVGPSRDTAPAVGFSAEPGTSASCRALHAGSPDPAFVPCGAPWVPALDSDGTWSVEVRLTDAAGNTSATGRSAAWLLDTRAPDAPVVSSPQSPGRDLAPTWSVVAEDGARLECRLTTPVGSVPDWSPCTTPYTTPVSGDGTYTLEVRATDAAGGTGPAGSASYVLDTTAPLAPVLSAPASPSRDRLPAFTFTPGDGETAACRVTRGSTVLQDWRTCPSPALVDLGAVADGAYTLAVRYTDLAGSTGPTTTAVQVLDTTAPLAPKATDVPASPNPSKRPRFGFSAEDGATLGCRVRNGDGLLVLDVDCSNPWTADLSGLPDGTYRYAVRATDRAGNTSEPAFGTYVLDSTAPEAAEVKGPLSPSAVRSPLWTVMVSAGAPECRLVRGTAVVADWRGCAGSYSGDLSTAPDGTYVLQARVRDDAGNLSATTTSPYVLDTAPAAPAVVSPPTSPGNDRHPTWVLSSPEVGVTAECRVLYGTGPASGRTVYSVPLCKVSAAGEPLTLDLPDSAADGTYELTVLLTDAAGNAGTEQPYPYVLDTVKPGLVTISSPASPSRETSPVWYLTSEPGTRLECQVASDTVVVVPRGTCPSTLKVDLAPHPDAVYRLLVRAVDAAGNLGDDVGDAIELDRLAPVRVSQLHGPTGPSRDPRPAWTFLRPEATTTTCVLKRGFTTVFQEQCSSPWSPDLAGQPDGSYTLTVRTRDEAGNEGLSDQRTYVYDTTAPDQPSSVVEPGTPSSSTSPRWAWALPSDASGSSCRTTRDGAVLLDWAPCRSPWTAALSDAPDGRYGFEVRAVDLAGNAGTVLASTYRLDRTAPPLAGFTDTPPAVDRDDTPTWQLETEPGWTPQCRLSGPDSAGTWGSCSPAARGAAAVPAGTFVAPLGARPDGRYVLELRGIGADGGLGPVSRSTYLLDRKAPEHVVFTDELDGTTGNTDRVTWTWDTPDPRAVVECQLFHDSRLLEPVDGSWAPCSQSRALDLEGAAQGAYALHVRTRDEAGNTGDAVVSTYVFDSQPPAAASFVGSAVLAAGGRTLTWTFRLDPGSRALCTAARDGQTVPGDPRACTGSYVLQQPGPGTYTLSIAVTDAAGNKALAVAQSRPFTVASAPEPVRVVTEGDPVTVGQPPYGPPSGPSSDPEPQPDAPAPLGTTRPVDPSGLTTTGPLVRTVAATTPVVGPGREPAAGPSPVERAVDVVRRVRDSVDFPSFDEAPGAVARVVGETVRRAARQPGLPIALVLVVVGFLLLQNRIDRRDPKLAAAPVEAEPELSFGPVLRLPGQRGPAGPAGGLA